MNPNPRFALLMARYGQFDTITLVLVGLALAAVLLGWVLSSRVRTRMDGFIKHSFFTLALIAWMASLAGALVAAYWRPS
jgi:hypothetical protein